MFQQAIALLNDAKKIVVIQAENPDGDSLGSALALEEILADMGKDVVLYCAIDIPKYMHYIKGWDRVTKDWSYDADAAVLVDTTSPALLVKTVEIPALASFLTSHPLLVIDHHQITEPLPYNHVAVIQDDAVATAQVIYELATTAEWSINPQAAEQLFIAIQSDSLGLTTPNTTARSYEVASALVGLGAVPSEIENRRREYMKKPAEILAYKGRLIERIEYSLEGKLALIHIPWDEIEAYSDRYNPSVLVLEEMRLVDTVEVAIAIKTYPDGKLTGKVRTNIPIAHRIAGYFGGGGHEYSAGFKVYENYDKIRAEVIQATDKASTEYATAIS